MTAQQNAYSLHAAYALGDKYKANISKDKDNATQWFLAAKLCYLLPTIPDRNGNQQQYIDQQKLYDLEQLQQKYKIIPPDSKLRIPNDVLILLKTFYAPWLHEIKQHLKERSSIRINEREKAFMAVFRKFDNHSLNVSPFKAAYLKQQHNKIDEWEGPVFQHLIIENNQRGKNNYYLTAVKDYDGYKKRCNNSQEDWSKKYDGQFIADCIDKASQIFSTNMVSKAEFAEGLLQETVQFKSSKKTDLIPNSWMFVGKNCVLLTAITDLLAIDKTEFNGGDGIAQKREKLMSFCPNQQNINDNVDVKEDHNMLLSPSNQQNVNCNILRSPSNVSNISNVSSDGNQCVCNNNNFIQQNDVDIKDNDMIHSVNSFSSNIAIGNTSNPPNISILYPPNTQYGQNMYNNNNAVPSVSPFESTSTGTNTSTPLTSISTPYLSTPYQATPNSNANPYSFDYSHCAPNTQSQGTNISNNNNEQKLCNEDCCNNQINQTVTTSFNRSFEAHHTNNTQHHSQYGHINNNNNNNVKNEAFTQEQMQCDCINENNMHNSNYWEQQQYVNNNDNYGDNNNYNKYKLPQNINNDNTWICTKCRTNNVSFTVVCRVCGLRKSQ